MSPRTIVGVRNSYILLFRVISELTEVSVNLLPCMRLTARQTDRQNFDGQGRLRNIASKLSRCANSSCP